MTNQNSINDFVFIGFNKQVIALDRYTGKILWDWKATKGTGFPAMLLDGDRLVVSIQGYTYCLDPLTGSEVWMNELKGYGTGIASVVSVRGTSIGGPAAAFQAAAAQQAAVTSGTHGA
ncbi:MAG: PQQ-binding-like beta-propeller repeat protein [Phycisphaerales bacterium]|jgi:outer membrane protein assembly factor BamB|nr:PQQ-binding-like beta-propeller repeat protein [Phycisphaerales bacterium]